MSNCFVIILATSYSCMTTEMSVGEIQVKMFNTRVQLTQNSL